jgi:hypothetical protein
MDEPIASFRVWPVVQKLEDWKLTIFPGRLRLESSKGMTAEFYRAELPDKVRVVNNILLRRVFVVTLDRRTTFRLEPDNFQLLQEWIGPPTRADLVNALKRRTSGIFVAILYCSAVPVAFSKADPGIGNLIAIFYGLVGLALLFSYLIAVRAPSRLYFLMDGICAAWWAITIALYMLPSWSQFSSTRRFLYPLFAVIVIGAALTAFRKYLYFSPRKMAEVPEVLDASSEGE